MTTRILVIEDNPDNLDLMSYLLRSFGHTVLSETDGGRGLQAARTLQPDLIVSDVHLPSLDGYEIARQLKQDPELSAVPLIAVTAYAMVGDRDKLLEAGFDGYIPKPIDPETFVGEVEKFLKPVQRGHLPTRHEAVVPTVLPPSLAAGNKILVLDDLEANLQLMRAILKPSGYEVLTAREIEPALELAKQHMPALIITDVHLGTRTGYEFLALLRQEPRLRNIPCTLVSSSSLGFNSPSPGEAGSEFYVLRPIEPKDLVAEVRKHLPGKRA